jgi:hypothetical protein
MENEERVKLFVGQVPKHMTEIQLLTLFREFSIVNEVNIIKEKTTRAPRGFFLIKKFLCFLPKNVTFDIFLFFFLEVFLCFEDTCRWFFDSSDFGF